jgi:hypothetical protein
MEHIKKIASYLASPEFADGVLNMIITSTFVFLFLFYLASTRL